VNSEVLKADGYPECVKGWGCLDHLQFSNVVCDGKAIFYNIASSIDGPGPHLDDGELIEVIIFAHVRGLQPREFVKALRAVDSFEASA
jgi:hypothetical protein